MEASTHPAPRRALVPVSMLWFGIFGAPAAWALQTIVDYGLVSHYCFPDDAPVGSPTFTALRATAIVVSVIVLAVVLVALMTAVRSWGATRHGHDAEHHELLEVGEGRARFMGLAGVLLGVVFLFAVLMNAVPLMTNTMCMP
ncbi:MAG: hypothetical protein ACJ796_15285 [Gemmatimonadaceae bacterium]